MKKYKYDCKCPKCGQDKIADEFIEKDGSYYVHNNYGSYRNTANEDIIRRCCRNCRYAWNEEPLEK